MLKFIVVGTGRCGTGTIARTLNHSGINCGHENIFKHVLESDNKIAYELSMLTAECAWTAVPWIEKDWIPKDTAICHLVRNPCRVIKSFVDINFFSDSRHHKTTNTILRNYVPEVFQEIATPLERAIKHYFLWNAKIETNILNRHHLFSA